MKEYYKADNELVKQVVNYFFPKWDDEPKPEFEIGGVDWCCRATSCEINRDGSVPTDRRIEGEVTLAQLDGTKHPSIRLNITVNHGIG